MSSRNLFMVKYGTMEQAKHASEHGDLLEKDAAVERITKEGTKEEASQAFDHYFNHALKEATHAGDPWYINYVIRNHPHKLQHQHLEKIMQADVPHGVHYAAVTNKWATPEVLRGAMNHKTAMVREQAVMHPNAPDDVIAKGLDDPHWDVKTAAAGRAYVKGQDWIQKNNIAHKL